MTHRAARPRLWIPLAIACGLLAASAPAARAQVTATGDSYSVAQGGTLDVPAPGVLGNDFDRDGLPLTASLVGTAPAQAASFSLATDGALHYVHDGSAGGGSVSFTYAASNGSTAAQATVTITVAASGPAPPEAVDDSYSVGRGGVLAIPAPGVLANDSDLSGNPLTATIVSPPALTDPAQATPFALNPDGSFSYANDPASTAPTDSFTYAVSNGSASATATVTISLVDPEPAPTGGESVSVLFAKVHRVRLVSQVGLSSAQQLLISADPGKPAEVSGDGPVALPLQTTGLRIGSVDKKSSAQAVEPFQECMKLALVAQARPGKYTLVVGATTSDSSSVAVAGATADGSSEEIKVTLADGGLDCSLVSLSP